MDVDRSTSKYITRYSLIDEDTGQTIIALAVSTTTRIISRLWRRSFHRRLAMAAKLDDPFRHC